MRTKKQKRILRSHARVSKKPRTPLPQKPQVLTASESTIAKEVKPEQQLEQNLRKIKVSVLTQKEERILEAYGQGGAKFAALTLQTTVEHVYQRVHRIKKKVEKSQIFLNRINSFRQRFPRVKKSLLIIERESWE